MFEIEIKSLLGDKTAADAFRGKLLAHADVHQIGTNSQLNHYFEGGDPAKLFVALHGKFLPDQAARLEGLLGRAKTLSIRTRQYDDKKVVFVVKATVDETTSANGIAREEFEEEPSRFNLDERLSLDALDQLILDAGFHYQSKWSREREEYGVGEITATIDRNAGYGYLAEFEQVVSGVALADATKARLRAFMSELGVEELDHGRLERMFAHYNANWPEYYGTEKTFTIF